jgi:lipid A 3-O-deacylase
VPRVSPTVPESPEPHEADVPSRLNRAGWGARVGALAAALSLVAALPALAQQTPSLDASAQDVPVVRPDPVGVWYMQDETAAISAGGLKDRYYVNGYQFGYVSGTDVTGAVQRMGAALWPGPGQLRWALDVTQEIFTPRDIAAPTWPQGDRPYAGILLGTGTLYRDVPDSRSMISLGLGLVGPGTGASSVNDWTSHILGNTPPAGWSSQLANEPLIELTSARTWRLAMGKVGGLETDALPNLAVGLGNLRIFAQTGVGFRIGQGLESDYGVPRLRGAPSGGAAFTPVRPFNWYVFAGVDGQGVMRDITLDGNDFRSGPSVTLTPWVGEAYAGIAVMAFGTRISYTQVVQSQEFQHQKGGPHQMGSLAVSIRF